MGILVSRGYVNSNFSLRPGGSADTNTSLIANVLWIITNYLCRVIGNQDDNRCPSSDELQEVTTWRIIAAGMNHSLVICNNGQAWGWGYNNYGEIGDNTTTSSSIPVLVL